MIARSIKTQFAVYVSVAALLILLSVALVSVAVIKHQLTRSADQNAHNFLRDYLAQIGLGMSSVDDSLEVYRIFYLDAEGKELARPEINRLLEQHVEELFEAEIVARFPVVPPNDLLVEHDQVITEYVDLALVEDSDEGIKSVSLSPDRVAIGQVVRLGRESFTVGVSYPKSLIQGRVDAVIRGFQILVPMLVLVAGITTWLAVRHVMRPVVSMARDANRINDQRLSQRLEVPAANNEFRLLATTLNAMLERIEKGQKSQEQFIADASHELRSPLSATKLLIETSQRDPGRVDWGETLAAMSRENERVIGLVDDLLTLAKLDESRVAHKMAPLDLKVQLMEESRRARRNRLIVNVPHTMVISANVLQFNTLMENLLDNADRYARSTIMVNVIGLPDAVVVTVDDDGPGIPKEHWDSLFDRFVRLDKSRARDGSAEPKPKPHGAGLGLAIARAIAENHGWTLRLSDGISGGACFRLSIPYSGNDCEAIAARTDTAGLSAPVV